MILGWHVEEVNPIIAQMGVSSGACEALVQVQDELQFGFTAGLIACGIAALRMKHWTWGLAIALIGLTPWIPVLLSFGLYFIGQHSASGWHHLREGLGLSSKSLWMKALPLQWVPSYSSASECGGWAIRKPYSRMQRLARFLCYWVASAFPISSSRIGF